MRKISKPIMKQDISNNLRIVYTGKEESKMNIIDLAVTPQALVYLHSLGNRQYLKPVDFISPQEIKDIKQWTVETVMGMAAEWKEFGKMTPEFINAVGLDLCILLETLIEADIIISKIWDSNNYANIHTDSTTISYNNMLQYEIPGYQYIELLNDELWVSIRKIKVEKGQLFSNPNYINKTVFDPPYWKKIIKYFLSVNRVIRQMEISLVAYFLIKLGLRRPPTPSLFVVTNKDNVEMLQYKKSIILDDYLTMLPSDSLKVNKLQIEIIDSLEAWFDMNTPVMESIKLYKNIVKKRITEFIKTRKDLLSAYIKTKSLKSPDTLKLILSGAIGCGKDAWASMAIEEDGGIVASTQHGGSYGSYHPILLFSDIRFNYFFSYGKPEISPFFQFSQDHSKAKWVKTGSSTLFKIQNSCDAPPKEVKTILYIMNLCVPFYSCNFPWEFVLQQFKVLEVLHLYALKYTIHVKAEYSGTVKSNNYPGLKFINDSPKEVMHKYDLLIVESGISTAILEAAVTNKFIVAVTSAVWEDSSKESLDMLAERAECFTTYDDFLIGLKKILDDPEKHLDPAKLSARNFIDTYCNTVSPESYVNTIKKTMGLE